MRDPQDLPAAPPLTSARDPRIQQAARGPKSGLHSLRRVACFAIMEMADLSTEKNPGVATELRRMAQRLARLQIITPTKTTGERPQKTGDPRE